MARNIIIDANILEQINRGNAPAAQRLLDMMAAGDKVYVCRQSYEEMVVNPAIPRTGVAKRVMLDELKIGQPPGGDFNRYKEFMAKNPRAPKKNPGAISGSTFSIGTDEFVAAAAYAHDYELWTFDPSVRSDQGKSAKALGVKVAPESHTIPLANAAEDYRVGLKALKLDSKIQEITLEGKIVYRAGAGGGSGAKLTISNRQVQLTPGDALFSPKGMARGAAIVTIGVIANAVLDFINSEIQRKAAAEALEKEKSNIIPVMQEDPFVGVLLDFSYLENTFAPDFAIVKPGARFLQIDVSFGTARAEADLAMRKQTKLREGGTIPENHLEHNFSYRTVSRWYPPQALPSVPTPTWFEPMLAGYTKLLSSLNPVADFPAAFGHFNGGTMDGMLAEMVVLRGNGWLDPLFRRFDKAQGIFKERVWVAYQAARQAGTPDAWDKYKASARNMDTYNKLPVDQQAAIRNVLGQFEPVA